MSMVSDYLARLKPVIVSALLLKLGLLAIFAVRAPFVMDEFIQLGWSKYLGDGLYDVIWPVKSAGYALFYYPAHAIGWDAASILMAGRLQTLLLSLGTLALLYGCARALGRSRREGLLVLLILLSFSNFIERAFRTIAEPLSLFFAVLALWVVLRGRDGKSLTFLLAGIASGLSFLATQKGIYFNVALGLGLVVDALIDRNLRDAVRRGALLVVGWLVALAVYCVGFGGPEFMAIARNLIFGPVHIATTGADPYGSLRHYVVQTLTLNPILYLFCFAGLLFAMGSLRRSPPGKRIAAVHTLVIAALVFAHNQPWPYVFIMALPFLALWSLELFDRTGGNVRNQRLLAVALGMGILMSFVRNAQYLAHDNRDQLALVERADAMLGPDDVYFDGIAMLPNHREPSTLWLDRAYVLKTRREGVRSDAYRMFLRSPPKLILWSYRMDAIAPVVMPIIAPSYVKVAPNVRLAGARLDPGRTVEFVVPVAGRYALYDLEGRAVRVPLDIGGVVRFGPRDLTRRKVSLRVRGSAGALLFVPVGDYRGRFSQQADFQDLFAAVYD
jgi:hypothetical protein